MAKGIALTSDQFEAQPKGLEAIPDSKLTVEFNCKGFEDEENSGDATTGHLTVQVPIGNQTPLTLNFSKDCQVP